MQRITQVSVVAMALVAGFTVPCAAQETITFEVRISDPVLTPGEVQTIEVWATVAPAAGALVPWNTNGGTGQLGFVMGYGSATFDLRNVQNAETGMYSNLAMNPVIFWMPGFVGQASPGGHVLGIVAQQPITPSAFNGGFNPLLIWRADWTPFSYEPRDVTLTTLVSDGPYAYLDIGLFAFVRDTWAPVYVSGSFTVVPGNATSCIFAMLALVASKRRRLNQGAESPRRGPCTDTRPIGSA